MNLMRNCARSHCSQLVPNIQLRLRHNCGFNSLGSTISLAYFALRPAFVLPAVLKIPFDFDFLQERGIVMLSYEMALAA